MVDTVAQLDQGAVFIDVYSQTESISERKAATEGTLVVNVEQGGAPASAQSIYVAGSGAALKTDSSGNATLTSPARRYRTQIAEKTVNLRVVGGLTRAVSVSIAEEGETMQIAAPEIEVFVVASFDPAGLEVSELDTANIVDTIGVELLTRFSDSDVAASVVRVPGISVQDDKYVCLSGDWVAVTYPLRSITRPCPLQTRQSGQCRWICSPRTL